MTSVVIACLALLYSQLAGAQDDGPQGKGSLRLEYQFIRTGAFDSSIGKLDIGETDGHTFMLSGDYALTDRWIVSASLPWIKKRHQGALPHNPALELTAYPEADQSVIDDGNFHSDWQDLYVTLAYRARTGALSITPFVSVGMPTNDYPFYAHAAVGRNIWHVPIGVGFNYTPHFYDYYIDGDVAWVITEKSLGVDVSHWLINLRAGYYLRPNFAPKIFVNIKRVPDGLSFPEDFDLTALNDINWYFHDRTIKHNFVNGGFGFDWFVNDRYMLSASWLTMLDPDQVNIVDFGYTLGITRFF